MGRPSLFLDGIHQWSFFHHAEIHQQTYLMLDLNEPGGDGGRKRLFHALVIFLLELQMIFLQLEPAFGDVL